MTATADRRFMRRALQLATRGAGHVSPNPMVGAVVVQDGVVVGEGFHARFGEAHAEVVALQQAGERASGATLYVSLEPCNHHGKTPPCTDAILRAGIARVVYAIADPHPVAGGGAARLRDAGVKVDSAVLHAEATELNAPFLFAASGATRPWVTIKLALSLDGAIVDASRKRGWLTGQRARAAVHQLRAQVDAIAVGAGTARADDPLLTARGPLQPRVPPRRVVFDRHATLSPNSALVRTARDVPVIVVTDGMHARNEDRLKSQGVTVMHASSLADAVEQLRADNVQHLLVEGGAALASAFLESSLADRLVIFQAPVLLGAGALSAFAQLPARVADEAPRLRVVARKVLGADTMTTYAVSDR